MKKLIIFFLLSITVPVLGQEEKPMPLDTYTITVDSSFVQLPHVPSFYLERASDRLMVSLGCGVGAGVISLIGVSAATELRDVNPSLFFGAAGALGVIAFIEFVGAIKDIGRAGVALGRVHLIGNGVSIDL